MIDACDACLRRGHLVGRLARRIAGAVDRPERRRAGLLALPDGALIEAVGGSAQLAAEEFLGRFSPDRAREDLDRRGVGATCRHSGRYPGALSDLGDPPPVLFHVGRTELLALVADEPAAVLVGARRASSYALEVAASLGRGLGASGVVVVSGLALGVDGAAHRGALDGGGETIAVLACGPEIAYPRSHAELHRAVAERGLVVSELPPGCTPFRWAFPARNRIMAALGDLTVVIEAGDASGTLITAEIAQQLGRTVAAVPGRVTARSAAGGNRLLREGAAVVRDAQDALDELCGVGVRSAGRSAAVPLDRRERLILDGVEAGLDMDALVSFADVPAGEARALLAGLEEKGLLERDGLAGWIRTASDALP